MHTSLPLHAVQNRQIVGAEDAGLGNNTHVNFNLREYFSTKYSTSINVKIANQPYTLGILN